MESEDLKDCSTCKHHKGYAIDDVSNECYPCVWNARTLGYYPAWEPKEKLSLKDLLREKLGQDDPPPARKTITITPHTKPMNDNVNSPNHYTTGGIETIDYIHAKLGHWGTINYCMGNVLKYSSRWQSKNGKEDLKKAQWYLNYVINLMEKGE